jgi:hypothetical protein
MPVYTSNLTVILCLSSVGATADYDLIKPLTFTVLENDRH